MFKIPKVQFNDKKKDETALQAHTPDVTLLFEAIIVSWWIPR